MSVDLDSIRISFVNERDKYFQLLNDDSSDPEVIAEALLNLIKMVKKSFETKASPDALYWYGCSYAVGDICFPQSFTKSIQYLNQAVMMRHVQSHSVLGDIYSANIDDVPDDLINMDKAITHYKAASKKNDGYASHRLAVIYSGVDGYQKDIRQALNYAEKSISQGSLDGKILMAYWMYNGNFVDRNLDRIQEILSEIFKESEKESFDSYDAHSKALFLCGLLYYEGELFEPENDIDTNQEMGLDMIEAAAESGEVNAIDWLRSHS